MNDSDLKSKEIYSKALSSLIKFCEYQERCESQLDKKISDFDNLNPDQIDELKKYLTDNLYINDKRFSEHFVNSKILKGWGRIKIRYALRSKRISDENINLAFENIDEAIYLENLKHFIEEKSARLKKGLNKYERKKKIALFLQSKGYETNLIFEELNRIFDEYE